MGMWKTVIAALGALAALLTVLNESIKFFPTGVVWTHLAWNWIWGKLTYSVNVPVSVLILSFLAMLYMHDFLERVYPSRKKSAKPVEQLVSTEERAVLYSLIFAGQAVEYQEVIDNSGLTKSDADLALKKLLRRRYVDEHLYATGSRVFALSRAGKDYAALHNMHKPPI